MDTGISILKHIRTILVSDESLRPMIKDKVFPIVADESTNMPFVILTKDNITPNYTKDGCFSDLVDFSIKIVSSTYESTIDLTEKIRNVLEDKKYSNIAQIRVSNVGADDYSDDAYVQEISFNAVFNIRK